MALVPKGKLDFDFDFDYDYDYDGTFTVRSSRSNAAAVATSLREYVADHGYQPYVLLGPSRPRTASSSSTGSTPTSSSPDQTGAGLAGG